LLTDTVGFIQNLPTSLVAAFRATLEELNEADVLVHVVDITHPQGYEQANTVKSIIEEIGVTNKHVITALNKADSLLDNGAQDLRELVAQTDPDSTGSMLREITEHYPNGVLISAKQGWGLDKLLETIDNVLGEELVNITIQLPYTAGKLAAMFRQKASGTTEEHTETGTIISGRLPARFAETFKPYVITN
jgi:GTP-binding protein HflX